jgi:integral membrane protein
MTAALTRYRIMAYTVGVMLLILCAVGLPLQYVWNNKEVVAVVGPIHGILYIIYLIAAYDLARRARFTIAEMLAMICAGFFPFLAFYIEHLVVQDVKQALAENRTESSFSFLNRIFKKSKTTTSQ